MRLVDEERTAARVVLGEWWLAGRNSLDQDVPPREQNVAGNFDDSGAGPWELSTHGLLGEDFRQPMATQRGLYPPRRTIWGITRERAHVSLLDCFLMRHPVAPRDRRDGGQVWVTDCHVTGRSWVLPSDRVDLIELGFDDLAAWAADIADFEPQHDGGQVTASLQPRTVSAVSCGTELRWGLELPDSRWGLELRPTATIAIETNTTVSEIAPMWARPFQRLMQLLCMRASRITRRAARLSGSANPNDRIEIVTGQRGAHERSDLQGASTIARHGDMLATRRELQNADVSLDTLLGRYWSKREDDNWQVALLHLLGSQEAGRETSRETSFLDAVLAAEQLHPTLCESRQIPRSEHRERVRSILEACPGEHRAWLEQALSNSNRKSFATQMQEIVEAAGDVGAEVIGAWPKLKQYSRDARNDTAHGNDYVRQESANKYRGTEVALQWIARRVLLEQLGMPPSAADALIQRHMEYRKSIRALGHWQAQIDYIEPSVSQPALRQSRRGILRGTSLRKRLRRLQCRIRRVCGRR